MTDIEHLYDEIGDRPPAVDISDLIQALCGRLDLNPNFIASMTIEAGGTLEARVYLGTEGIGQGTNRCTAQEATPAATQPHEESAIGGGGGSPK
jgi:hypothetical protein